MKNGWTAYDINTIEFFYRITIQQIELFYSPVILKLSMERGIGGSLIILQKDFLFDFVEGCSFCIIRLGFCWSRSGEHLIVSYCRAMVNTTLRLQKWLDRCFSAYPALQCLPSMSLRRSFPIPVFPPHLNSRNFQFSIIGQPPLLLCICFCISVSFNFPFIIFEKGLLLIVYLNTA